VALLLPICFWIIAIALVTAALCVVLSRKIVTAVVGLIAAFMSVAGVFILLSADFVAVSQIIIYGVGLSIIMLFAIMLTGKRSDAVLGIARAPRTFLAALVGGGFFLTVLYAVTNGFMERAEFSGLFNIREASSAERLAIQVQGTAPIIGKAMLTTYLLPFEIASILLLAGIIGAVAIGRKSGERIANPTTDKADL
jgi:NADH:ubiquinone oxidoreductase subunit 6 (subunit J)